MGWAFGGREEMAWGKKIHARASWWSQSGGSEAARARGCDEDEGAWEGGGASLTFSIPLGMTAFCMIRLSHSALCFWLGSSP